MIPSPPDSVTTLEGQLERISYFNAESHYTIATLKTSKTDNLVTVVGPMAGVSAGQGLRLKGTWETHPKYGQQFKIESYEITLPASVGGIKKYLESGIIKGIGPSMATRLVRRFGSETLEIIEKHPEHLLEVEGIGKAKAALICNAWRDHHVIRGLMQFLQEMGVKASFCARIFKEFGLDAVNVIRRDPYRLANDIPGIGFYVADAVARRLGAPKDDPKRMGACIRHLMKPPWWILS
ncbi:MAG: helix-hairpin-helix domain-containing protein [Pseudomonadota bacterium]